MQFQHLVIHKNNRFHSAFPEIIRLQNNDLVCVFRQAPLMPPEASKGTHNSKLTHNHVQDSSRIVLVRSKNDGISWDSENLVVIDQSDGTNDLNMAMISQVSSGEIIMNNHRWLLKMSDGEVSELKNSKMNLSKGRNKGPMDNIVFDSLYFSKSSDNGFTWEKPSQVSIADFTYRAHTGKNGVVELPDGTWLLPFHGLASGDIQDRMFIARSYDKGYTWTQPSTVAYDPEQKIGFHEPPLIRLPSGRLLTIIRTNDADGYLYQAYSDDDGWTWQGLKRCPMWGHPCNLLYLPTGRILCTYGYRKEPFGVRAAFSEDDGITWDIDNEVIIRKDGLHRDLGYPASILLSSGKILSVYYFHDSEGIRYIGGSIWSENDVYQT